MVLLLAVLQVAAVVVALHVLCLFVVRPSETATALRNARRNAREAAPMWIGLGAILAVNGVVRDAGVELSWLIGVNVTRAIHALEGSFVATIQSFATPPLTAYFSFVYVFGYVFLLTFPLVAYAIHDDVRPLRTTLVAYSLNYVIGLGCYVLFVAYGPRNFMPDLVEPLLYVSWPHSQLLVSQVNANTNVFPSLHTSLSVTVALVAYRFRALYPRWTPIAVGVGGSITLSTMYLGIHWLTDVVAGIALAALSVAVASRVTAHGGSPFDASSRSLRRSVVGWVRNRKHR
ncbi:MAG: phosphatase PAP2 family protein [Haloplanus sp.]